jgi:hypothetical protein
MPDGLVDPHDVHLAASSPHGPRRSGHNPPVAAHSHRELPLLAHTGRRDRSFSKALLEEGHVQRIGFELEGDGVLVAHDPDAPTLLRVEHLLQETGVVEVGTDRLDLVARKIHDRRRAEQELLSVGLDHRGLFNDEGSRERRRDTEFG